MDIPKEFIVNNKKVVLREELFGIIGKKIYVVIDFDRNFENQDLSILPSKIVIANSLQDEYLIKKYNILIGELN